MSYTWIDNWAKIPDSVSGYENGRTHGVCVSQSGNIIVFHQAQDGLVTYDPDGNCIASVGGDRWLGAHGLTKVIEGTDEFLWLVDQDSCEVAKTTIDGSETLLTIDKPDHPDYNEKNYCPTWAAQNPDNGDIWVGDGYGASLVHRYSKDGDYMQTLDGTEGAGRFAEPHGINFSDGENGQELFITDRANHRIVVYDGDGNFLRSSFSCHSPCCFDFLGDLAVVPELFTGVKVLNKTTLECLTESGASDSVAPRPDGGWWPPEAPEGWPNLAGSEHVRSDVFNSPHGACFAPNGDIYVVEWIVGGRITKLEKG